MAGPRAARRLAAAALYGGGGIGVVGGGIFGLLKAEAKLARRAIGMTEARPPSPDGTYGDDLPGTPIRLLVIGDSAAVGYGMTDAGDTPPALMGHGLAQIAGRPVEVRSRAVVGARSADLDGQIDLGVDPLPDVVAVVVGANDVTHSVPPAQAVRSLDGAVRRLRALGCEVVVGTCPDLGTVRPLPQPLRLVAQTWSRRLAAAQMITTVEAGGRSVSLANLLGRDFSSAPDELFGADRFHPSLAGYASMVAAMLPSVAVAVDAWDDEEEAATYPSGTVLPVSFAAARAASVGGTEVAATDVAGDDRGPRGRWASLRRR
ncbi:SGNH/GDSL hydrolase family protein [Solicola sp. PLA-1-18]|uniref:SGNH/GDSL hydrolase family protein n=1 Tax=Solicola sp. PLA-1-18 TaxID=3380532 RepID=UPI003B7B6045